MILEEAKKIARIFWANAAPMGDSIRAATALKKMGLSCVKQGLIKARNLLGMASPYGLYIPSSFRGSSTKQETTVRLDACPQPSSSPKVDEKSNTAWCIRFGKNCSFLNNYDSSKGYVVCGANPSSKPKGTIKKADLGYQAPQRWFDIGGDQGMVEQLMGITGLFSILLKRWDPKNTFNKLDFYEKEDLKRSILNSEAVSNILKKNDIGYKYNPLKKVFVLEDGITIKAPAQGKVFVKAPFSIPRVITNPLNLKNQLISILSGLRK